MNPEEILEQAKKAGMKTVKYSAIGAGVLVGLITINASIFNVEIGEYAIEQSPSGKIEAHMTPGYKFKVPFVSNVWYYDQITTVTYDNDQEGAGSSKNPPYRIGFSDTYGGDISGSFRVEISPDPEKLKELHRAYKSYDNFIQNGVEKFTNELLTYTAMQFTGESFMQGGQNEYKTRLEDQAKHGLYVTKRQAIKVAKEAGIVDKDKNNASRTETSEAIIYKNIIQRDSEGKPLRKDSSMVQYGVTADQVTISAFAPESDLQSFMSNKKEQVRKRAKLVEEQENERQQAITEKLKGDRERVVAKQQMLREKDQAEIEISKQVEVAKLQAEKEKVERQKLADLAVIDKKKELQMASDNEAIQKANFKAAKYEAQAIKEKGLAEAAVKKANYEAIDKTLYTLEKQVEITENLREAFRGTSITMPNNYIVNGTTDGTTPSSTNMDVMMQLLQLDKLDQISKINK